MNYEFERESGFINSQPSLAECLTSFPPVADSFQSSSIKSSTLSRPTLIPPPFEQTIPSLNPGSHPRHGRPRHSPDGCSPLPTASLPPEYPWMREKKASKRNHLPTSTATTIANGPVSFSPKEDDEGPLYERSGALLERDTCSFQNNSLSSTQQLHNGETMSFAAAPLNSNDKNLKHFPNPSPTVPGCMSTMGPGSASGPDNSDSPPALDVSIHDFQAFSSDSCLQLSDAASPSLSESLDSPVDISTDSFYFFSESLTTIDLQHLNY
ncbi:hypothetical protein FQN60_007588 [Etheostoma spectabile]|uniref:Homeobox domain-containing protein n=1 Tax=Etheostoma spectabile TaxID=54343 RepID=A0A5J5CXZ0_9PERO|nr:hypothetical protein FQN60_007588 [Etheostoma spectabile]